MSDIEKPIIDVDACTGCSICVEECTEDALEMKNDVAALIVPDKCTGCGTCEEVCPLSAIIME